MSPTSYGQMKKLNFPQIVLSAVIGCLLTILVFNWQPKLFLGAGLSSLNSKEIIEKGKEEPQGSSTDEQVPQDREANYQKPQEKIVSVVEAVSPSVVSIVITKDLPKWEYYDPF